MTFMKNEVYYAGDGLPLRIGDVVTKAENVPNSKYAYNLIRGVVVNRDFGKKIGEDYGCYVRFDETADRSLQDYNFACRMSNLVHLNLPLFDETEFFTMLEVNR